MSSRFAKNFSSKVASILSFSCMMMPAVSSAASQPWVRLSESDPQAYQALYDSHACEAFREMAYGERDKGGFQTDQLVVIKDGKLVYEWAGGDYKEETPHTMWSVSKTISSLILGTAVQEGKVSLDDRLADYFPASLREVSGPNEYWYDQVKISNLLSMTSGFDWKELYESNPRESTVLPMLYGSGRKNTLKFALNRHMVTEPGSTWVYGSNNTALILGVLRKVYGRDYNRLPWKNLFDKLGMDSVHIEKDDAGNFIGQALIHMNARDMAKIGQLLLQDGVWNGERILPEGWVTRARTVNHAVYKVATKQSFVDTLAIYSEGAFWLNNRVNGLKSSFRHAPEDVYTAAGHHGQFITVFPSANMVIARTGYDATYWENMDQLMRRANACFNAQPGVGK